jgi:type IV secretion system protein VirB10
MAGGDPSITTPLDPTSPEAIFQSEEQNRMKEEERALQRAQRSRVLEERKSSSMFKMQGGGGGDSSTIDQNSIIITNKDSLDTVTDSTNTVQTTKVPDLSRTLIQGKIVSAILETSINTDVNSQIRAIVSRDIYSESNKNILIPKGSKLIGSFQATGLKNGVSRINITWSRLIRTDGLNISLNATAADDLGRGGIDGELDNKYTQTIRNSLLSSVVTIASSLLVEKVTGSVGITNSTTTGLTGEAATQTSGKVSDYAIVEATQNFADEMKDLIDNLKQENPTIRVAQGTKLNVVVNQDMTLPIYKQKK